MARIFMLSTIFLLAGWILNIQALIIANDDGCPASEIPADFPLPDTLFVPEIVHSGDDGHLCGAEIATTIAVVRRSGPWDLYNGARYTSAATSWVVDIKGFGIDQYPRSKMYLPYTIGGIAWLARTVATAITNTPSHMWYISENIGGGWYVEGLVSIASGYEIPDIPREIMMDLVTSACHSALDWSIPGDNGFHFDIWTKNYGEKIFSFMVYPASR